jgi:hypothetical protein
MNGKALLSATLTVAFQGVPGAFGEEAVCAYFEQEMGIWPEKAAWQFFQAIICHYSGWRRAHRVSTPGNMSFFLSLWGITKIPA